LMGRQMADVDDEQEEESTEDACLSIYDAGCEGTLHRQAKAKLKDTKQASGRDQT